jgi:2'-5' RNA ligase
MRLFIAIPLPEDAAGRAFALLPSVLPGLRRVRAENLHLTLAFLGETAEERLADVEAATAEAAAEIAPFRIRLDRASRFPERGRPRVVWLGIGEGLTPVERLGSGVASGLRARALRFDDRPLSPHLTLARVREDASLAEARTVAAAVESLRVEPIAFAVDAITVFQSVLSPKGPRYTPRASCPLVRVMERQGER